MYFMLFHFIIHLRARRRKEQRRLMIRKASENLTLTSCRILAMPSTAPQTPVKTSLIPPIVGQKVSRIEEETELNTEFRQS